MKQHEAVLKAMDQLGSYATLGALYQATLKIPDCVWNTKDPFANIRRIVQTNPLFFKIKPGLWGLSSEKERILLNLGLSESASVKQTEHFTHSYFQGLLLEIGILKNHETYIPAQDKNKPFLQKRLGNLSSLPNIYHFTFDWLLNKAKSVDVIWFNERKFPDSFFEVEHSTNIQNALDKFSHFCDFKIDFYIVADSVRKNDYEEKISHNIYKSIGKNVRFLDYDTLSKIHANTSERAALSKNTGINF